ncbi:hypothetical protein C2I18_26365 [Paenibacillus sp. PK3_47]|nr:hypothetical protein C2I18_26365 [Paenibacillus sp. PK3_47]
MRAVFMQASRIVIILMIFMFCMAAAISSTLFPDIWQSGQDLWIRRRCGPLSYANGPSVRYLPEIAPLPPLTDRSSFIPLNVRQIMPLRMK